jgi:hypothetical protein
MAEAKVEKLTEREREYLEHVRQAQELGVSFAEYCRRKGLSINPLYWVRSRLVRKGVLSGRDKSDGEKPSGFAPVHMVPSAVTACRIRHPSGWVIECESLPQAQWLTALLSGASA